MLRKTLARLIVPQGHAMIPGRASERGFMYRSSRQNLYCRLANTTRNQRSFKENFLFNLSMFPDVAHYAFAVMIMTFIFLPLVYCFHNYSLNTHKNKHFAGGLNQSERFQRNADMDRIFRNHEAIAEQWSAIHGQFSAIEVPNYHSVSERLTKARM